MVPSKQAEFGISLNGNSYMVHSSGHRNMHEIKAQFSRGNKIIVLCPP